ncbi:MAG: nicotinate phosphoribosyltransferase [Candidatus Rokubacteria bacterium]|nr:nicotinate phosphoribosyltransferase [Candidatus Rokubacteria bacterium]
MTDRPAPGAFVSGPLVTRDAALFTDLYEITMAASYLREGMTGSATFSLFVRKLPKERAFLVAAGLEDILNYLRDFRFSADALRYLSSLRRFDAAFLDFLSDLRFTGEVRAVPEGTVIFQDEPLLEVTAPIIEAQIVETAVLNLCHFQTLLASKAARSVIAARGRPVVEFGLRRTHGIDAGMKAARCAFIAGATMSSNVLAGLYFGIPPTGTMAHSYVTAFPHEIDAFRAFARAFPAHTILLIDTYDTVAAARKAVEVAMEMEAQGQRLAGVRLDSGDIVTLSKAVRRVLDQAGLPSVRIFVSGGLDEESIDQFLAEGAPIDAFGVGTRMDVSADAPYLDMAYKLVEYQGRHVLKTSPGKTTWTGRKQVYRVLDANGRFSGDVLALRDEPPPGASAELLLRTVMESGRPLAAHPPLTAVRDYCLAQIAQLPQEVRRIRNAGTYPVRYSDRLVALQRSLEAELEATEVVPARRRTPRSRRNVMAKRSRTIQPPRSPKAGRPPEEIISPPRVRRRQKTAHVQLRKGTTLLETGHGPRVVRGAKSPKVKKR